MKSSTTAICVYSSRQHRNDFPAVEVKEFNSTPIVRKGLRTRLGNYIPSRDYKRHLEQLKAQEQITDRDQIKAQLSYRKSYCRELIEPYFVLQLIKYCKTEWSLTIERRRRENPDFYRKLKEALNANKPAHRTESCTAIAA